jgi:hypothetical protein
MKHNNVIRGMETLLLSDLDLYVDNPKAIKILYEGYITRWLDEYKLEKSNYDYNIFELAHTELEYLLLFAKFKMDELS